MALPAQVSPLEDARARLWLPVTVRVAWDLLLARVRVRPAVLAEAREHVLRCLPPGVSAEEAEELAGVYTGDYLGRVQHQRVQRPDLDPDLGFSIPRAWRDRLVESLDPVGDAVLRMHYGDGLSMEDVERHAAIDGTALGGAREGVREALRSIADADGVPLDEWSDDRIDRLIRRTATIAGPNCPGPAGLLSDAGREHAGRCPRCSRAVRLIRQGVIAPADLFLPEGEPLVPPGRIGLVAVMLHPDGKKHRAALARLLGKGALEVGADAWLLPLEMLPELTPGFLALAEAGTPPRHHLRGAAVEGLGRWRRNMVLGPLPVQALEEARARPWSEIDRVGELPAPLPPPPSAMGWWGIAGASLLAAVLAGVWALSPPHPVPDFPIEASFRHADGSWDLRFDTGDLAVVDVLVQDEHGLHVFAREFRAEKGQWATGEGDFHLNLSGSGVAIVSSADGVPEIADLALAASRDADPLRSLAKRVQDAHPTASVALTPAPKSGP